MNLIAAYLWCVCVGVGGVRYDGVIKGRFSIYGSSNVCGGSLYGNVKVVQGMVISR